MAYADGNIVIGTSVDVGGVSTGLANIKKSIKRLGRIALTGLSVTALSRFAKAAIDAASNLQEVQNVVDVSFRDMEYKVEQFTDIAIRKFGISELAAKQTAGSFMAMGKAIGFDLETASDMAIELTGLAGDFASFYNISQEYAKVALSAVYTGETETLKRYGIILTEANLQQYAMTKGITAKVKAMKAEDKAMLRYMYIMEQTNDMHHDFERTTDSWANQTRVLQENWKQLLAEIGSGLIVKFQPVVAILNTIVQKLMQVFAFINSFLGIVKKTDGAGEEFSDTMGDVADSIDDAAASASHALAPFDKLNNITTSANGAAGVDVTDLYKEFDLLGYVMQMLGDSSSMLDDLDVNVKMKLGKVLKVLNEYKGKINNVLDKIKLKDFFSAGKSLGDLATEVEAKLSDAIANVDWKYIGGKIGDFFKGIIWSDALFGWVDVMTAAIDGVLDLAIAGIDKITVDDIIELGTKVSDTAKKFFKWLTNAIKKVDWHKIGKKIGTFLESIDWVGILSSVGSAIWTAIQSAIDLYSSMFDAEPIVTTVLTAIALAKWSFKLLSGMGVTNILNQRLANSISDYLAAHSKKLGNLVTKTLKVGGSLISIGLGVALTMDRLEDIKSGDVDATGWYARISDLIDSALVSAGLAGLVSTLGIASGGAAFTVLLPITFLASLALDLANAPDADERAAKRLQEIKEKVEGITWMAELKNSIEDFNRNTEGLKQDLIDMENNFSYYEELAKAWYEMSQNYANLSEGEKIIVEQYGQELVSIFGELAPKVNEVSKAYEGTWRNLELVIQKSEEYQKLKILQEFKEDSYKKLIALQKARHDAEEEYAEVTKIYEYWVNAGGILDTMRKHLGSTYEAVLSTYVPSDADLADARVRAEAESKLIDDIVGMLQRSETEFNKLDLGGVSGYLVEEDLSDVFGQLYDNLSTVVGEYAVLTETLNEYDTQIQQIYTDQVYWNNAYKETASNIAKIENDIKVGTNLENFQKYFENLPEVFKQLYEGNESLPRKVAATLNGIENSIKSGQEPTKAAMTTLYGYINNAFNDLPEGSIPEDIKNTLDSVLNLIETDTPKAYETLMTLSGTLCSGFEAGLNTEDGKSKLEVSTENAIEDVVDLDKKPDLMGKLKTFGSNIIKPVLAGYDESAKNSKGESVFADRIDFILDAFVNVNKDFMTKLKNFGSGIFKNILKGYDEESETHSPSKVMMERGKYLVEGLAEGIMDNTKFATEAIKDMVDEAVDTVAKTPMDIAVPELTVDTKIKAKGLEIPDVVKGLELPTNASFNAARADGGQEAFLRKIRDTLADAVNNLQVNATFEVNGDPNAIFNVVQSEASIYRKRTGRIAFT